MGVEGQLWGGSVTPKPWVKEGLSLSRTSGIMRYQ